MGQEDFKRLFSVHAERSPGSVLMSTTAELGGTKFKIHATAIVDGKGRPGELLALTKTGLIVACGEGAVEIRSLQAEGGKRMAAPDYFRGHPLEGLK